MYARAASGAADYSLRSWRSRSRLCSCWRGRDISRPFVRALPPVRFHDGAGPAAIGAILGVAIPLALALGTEWQFAVLAGAGVSLIALRRSAVTTLLLAAFVGIVVVQLGAPLP